MTGYQIDLVRVGLARKFNLRLVHEPLAECARRHVDPDAMIRLAETTDVYGRPRENQRRLF